MVLRVNVGKERKCEEAAQVARDYVASLERTHGEDDIAARSAMEGLVSLLEMAGK